MTLKRTLPFNSIELSKKPKKIDIEFKNSLKYRNPSNQVQPATVLNNSLENNTETNLITSNARVILYNTNTDLISGTIEYDYTKMINVIKSNLSQNENNQFQNIKIIKITAIDNDFISFYIPNYLKLDKILSITNFETNFSKAFGTDLQNVNFYNKDFRKIIVLIKSNANLVRDTQKTLDDYELTFFRTIFCFSLSYLFNLKCAVCACYPQDINQLLLWKSGINMNCINAAECKSFLTQNPGAIDPMFVGPCNNAEIISVIQNNLNFYSSQDIKINVHIKNSITQVLNRLAETFKNQNLV